MKVLTKPYGEMEIDEAQRIRFPRGLFGFEDLRDFALLDAAQQPFYWLQSLERVEVAFVLIDPLFFRPDYTPDVDAGELEEIGAARAEDRLVFAVVTIPENSSQMTANLQGPAHPESAHAGRAAIDQQQPPVGSASRHPGRACPGETRRLMLILARRIGESIMIGDQVELTVVDIKGDQVKLGINAPSQVKVYRREVYAAIQEENRAAASAAPQTLPSLQGLMGRNPPAGKSAAPGGISPAAPGGISPAAPGGISPAAPGGISPKKDPPAR